jgi:ATP-dependent Clp protease, protease subunit
MIKQIIMNEFKKYATQHLNMSSMHLDNYITNFSPTVVEERQSSNSAVVIDVFSRLMMDRIIFMGVPVNDYVANVIQAQMLFLESVDPKKEIQMFINSPGGSVIAGMGIYDTMQYISPNVATTCTGLAASMGAVLLCAGSKRTALPHARVMIHQPSGGMQGQFTDMEISYKLIKQLRGELYNIMAHHTGKTFEEIERDSERDKWMTATEAKEYGLVDEVLTRK